MGIWSLAKKPMTAMSGALTNVGATAPTSSYTIPLSGSYQSAGKTLSTPTSSPAPAAPAPSYSNSTLAALGGASATPTGTAGGGYSNMADTGASARNLQPVAGWANPMTSQASAATRSPSTYGAGITGAGGQTMRDPGAYEDWHAQNKSRYSAPTTLSSYYNSVAGKFSGQRYQSTTSQNAYANMQNAYAQPSYGQTNAQDISGQLRRAGAGEGVMNDALGYFGGPNQASQYYGDNRAFYGSEGDIERYYDANAGRFQQAGAGEQTAQGILGSSNLTGLYDNRLVGDELDYFRDPLRAKSYSEQLYESGNTGLNTFYDRERETRQRALEDKMAAMGVFASGETAESLYQLEGELGAAQARDMAGLAGQADDQRLGRAGALASFSSAAADEELGRGGLMLDASGRAMELDRDAIARLTAGGNLANMSSGYALNRVNSGMNAANTADQSRFAQGAGMANIGQAMSAAELSRLQTSGSLGLDASAEERARMSDLFGASMGVDSQGLAAQQAELDWLRAGGDMAGNVDNANLDWLNAGGSAARGAQDAFQGRVGQLYGDTADLGGRMAGTFGQMTAVDASEQMGLRQGVIQLMMAQYGMDAAAAERQADEWMQAGMMPLQVYTMMKSGGAK